MLISIGGGCFTNDRECTYEASSTFARVFEYYSITQQKCMHLVIPIIIQAISSLGA